jgi:hypothetical protein
LLLFLVAEVRESNAAVRRGLLIGCLIVAEMTAAPMFLLAAAPLSEEMSCKSIVNASLEHGREVAIDPETVKAG